MKILLIAIVAITSLTVQAKPSATTTPPPDGKMALYYEDGSKKVEKQYKDGRPIGTWRSWYQSGAKRAITTFESGIHKDSKVTFMRNVSVWYEDGTRNYLGTSNPTNYKEVDKDTGKPKGWLSGTFEANLYDEEGRIVDPRISYKDDSRVFEVEITDSTTDKLYCFPWTYPGTEFEDCVN